MKSANSITEKESTLIAEYLNLIKMILHDPSNKINKRKYNLSHDYVKSVKQPLKGAIEEIHKFLTEEIKMLQSS